MTGRDLVGLIYAIGVLAALFLGRDLGAEQERARAQQAQSLCSEVRAGQYQLAAQQRATAGDVQAAVRSARDDVGEVGRACAEVAETCAVPGWWMDVEVVPLPRLAEGAVRR